jgi:hypothetical protein
VARAFFQLDFPQAEFKDSVEAFDFAKAMPPASVKVQVEMPRGGGRPDKKAA